MSSFKDKTLMITGGTGPFYPGGFDCRRAGVAVVV